MSVNTIGGSAGTAAAGTSTLLAESTAGDKFKAATVLGINAGDELLVLSDRNFVLAIWRKAASGSQVKNAALAAFTSSDQNACTTFIQAGIYTAKQADDDKEIADALAAEAMRTARRTAVAQVPGMPVTEAMFGLSDKEFIFLIWQTAKDGSKVKAAAAKALATTSTPADYTAFITSGIFTARAADVQQDLADQAAAEQAAKERQANLDAKTAAVSAVLKIVADTNTINLNDHDFVAYILNHATGTEVKIAARNALASTDPAALHTFIFTDIYTANDRDVAAAEAAELKRVTQRVQDIADAAQIDGHQPNLLAAARVVLAKPTMTTLGNFLDHGQHEAAALDLATPVEGLVIELQVQSSKRCLQVSGPGGYGAEATGASTELWDCAAGSKQRWVLHQGGNGQYYLQNISSFMCLAVRGVSDGDGLTQYQCANNADQHWEFRPVGDYGFFELRNVATGRVAAAEGNGANGTFIVQYTTEHAPDQIWRIIDVNHTGNNLTIEPGLIELQGVPSGRCIQNAGLWDTPGQGALGTNAAMELWDCVGSSKMKWTVIDLGGQKYQLRNALSGQCLQTYDSSPNNDVALVQGPCSTAVIQQWQFVTGTNGAVKLKNYQTGLVATALNNGTGNATLIRQANDNNAAEQQWNIIRM